MHLTCLETVDTLARSFMLACRECRSSYKQKVGFKHGVWDLFTKLFTVDCHWSEQSLVDAPNLGHWAASQTASLPGLSLPSCRARAQGRRRRMFFFHPRHFGATLGRFGSVLVHENTHTGGDSVTFVERKRTSCVSALLFLQPGAANMHVCCPLHASPLRVSTETHVCQTQGPQTGCGPWRCFMWTTNNQKTCYNSLHAHWLAKINHVNV